MTIWSESPFIRCAAMSSLIKPIDSALVPFYRRKQPVMSSSCRDGGIASSSLEPSPPYE